MKNSMKFDFSLIDEWISCKWGKTRYSLNQLNYEIAKKINLGANNLDLHEFSYRNIKKTLNYINNFKNISSLNKLPVDFIIFSHNNKYIYRSDDIFWMNTYRDKIDIKHIKKFKYFDIIKNHILSLNEVEFEQFCAETFTYQNYQCEVSTKCNQQDGGLDFHGLKEISNNPLSINFNKSEYIFGQCKKHINNISTGMIKEWIYDINQFKNKKGYAYEVIWPYKDDEFNVFNTKFIFCTTANISNSALRILKNNNVIVLGLDYLTYLNIPTFKIGGDNEIKSNAA